MVLFDIIKNRNWETRKERSRKDNRLTPYHHYWTGAEQFLEKHKFIDTRINPHKNGCIEMRISDSFAEERRQWIQNPSNPPAIQTSVSDDNNDLDATTPNVASNNTVTTTTEQQPQAGVLQQWPHPFSGVARANHILPAFPPPNNARTDTSTTPQVGLTGLRTNINPIELSSSDASPGCDDSSRHDDSIDTSTAAAPDDTSATEHSSSGASPGLDDSPRHGDSIDTSTAAAPDDSVTEHSSSGASPEYDDSPRHGDSIDTSTAAANFIDLDELELEAKDGMVQCERCHLRMSAGDFDNHLSIEECHRMTTWRRNKSDNKKADEQKRKEGVSVRNPPIVLIPSFRTCACNGCLSYRKYPVMFHLSDTDDESGGDDDGVGGDGGVYIKSFVFNELSGGSNYRDGNYDVDVNEDGNDDGNEDDSNDDGNDDVTDDNVNETLDVAMADLTVAMADATIDTTGNDTTGNDTTGNEDDGNDTTGNDTTGNDDDGNDDDGNDDDGNEDDSNEDSTEPVQKSKRKITGKIYDNKWVECERCHSRILEKDYNYKDFRTHRNNAACHSSINWKCQLWKNKLDDKKNEKNGSPIVSPRIIDVPSFGLCECYSCSTYWSTRRLKTVRLPGAISTVNRNALEAIDNKLKLSCLKRFRNGTNCAPLKSVLIATKLSLQILGGSIKGRQHDELRLEYSHLDLATYWTLRGHPEQKVRLSLPSQCFQLVYENNHDQFLKFVQNVGNYKDMFSYNFIDITVWHGGHFSKAFVVNPQFVLYPDTAPVEVFCGILYCNSSDADLEVHKKEDVARTTIKMLNWVCEDLNFGGAQFNEANLPAYKLDVPIQADSWSCGPRALLASDRLTVAFVGCLECPLPSKFYARDNFKLFSIMFMKYDNDDIYKIRDDLRAIVEGLSSIGKATPNVKIAVQNESNTETLE